MSLPAKYEEFLSLVRLGVGNSFYCQPKISDWEMIRELASTQGLSAIILDGIDKLPKEKLPPKDLLLNWIGSVVNSYESNYKQYEKRIGQLANFYKKHGFRMMVIKGYGLSLNYPIPSHRPCGDIDIWQFGQQQKADEVIGEKLGIKVDNSHHHHSVFSFKEYTVENHYDWVNVYGHRSSRGLEKIFKDLAKDDTHWVEVYGERVYIPSQNLHALFLLRHTMLHFVSTSMTLRQLLDWAFFCQKNSNEVDWDWLVSTIEKYQMKDFYNCINAICVEDLGFESKLFGQVQFEPSLKDRILKDTLSPEFTEEQPLGMSKRVLFKFRRWKSNAWKRRICYDESDVEMFMRSVWEHIVKPAHI